MSFWQDGDLLTPSNLQNRAGGADTVTVEGDNSTRATKATAVQNAIDAATNNNKSFVFVPESFTNYDASAVTFDNSVRMVREGNLSDVYDVKAYGAAGDGTTDDTSAIQATIDAAISNGAAQGKVFISAGDYNVNASLTISDVEGLIVEGAGVAEDRSGGTKIKWTGDDDTDHLFELPDIRQCVFRDFAVQVPTDTGSGGSPTLDSVFHLVHGSGGATPTARTWENVKVKRPSGTDIGGYKRAWYWDETGSGGNNNNDLDSLVHCHAEGFSEESALIDGTQSKSHLFLDCGFNGNDVGKHLVRSSGSYRWIGGAGGGSTTQAAFVQEAVVDNILIQGFNFEGCDRLYEETFGVTSASLTVSIRDGRFATNGLNADGDVVKVNNPGPLIIEGNLFGNSNDITFSLNQPGPQSRARIAYNRFPNDPDESIFSTLGTGGGELEVTGNIYHRAGSGAQQTATFADGDATPSVQANDTFMTSNTDATTITDFDNGWYGKEIKIIFGDGNTTIDFTGTNLKGNSGADWSPSEDDHMTCVYDGTDWYCDISDNTA